MDSRHGRYKRSADSSCLCFDGEHLILLVLGHDREALTDEGNVYHSTG